MDRPDSGHAVIVRRQIMKLTSDWVSFRKNLDRLYPRHDELPLEYASDEDDGKVYKKEARQLRRPYSCLCLKVAIHGPAAKALRRAHPLGF